MGPGFFGFFFYDRFWELHIGYAITGTLEQSLSDFNKVMQNVFVLLSTRITPRSLTQGFFGIKIRDVEKRFNEMLLDIDM